MFFEVNMSNITFGQPGGTNSDNYFNYSDRLQKNDKTDDLTKIEHPHTSSKESSDLKDSKTRLVNISHTAQKIISQKNEDNFIFKSESRDEKKLIITNKKEEIKVENKILLKEKNNSGEEINNLLLKEHETLNLQSDTNLKTTQKELSLQDIRSGLNDLHFKIGKKYVSHDELLEKFLLDKNLDRDNFEHHISQFIAKHTESGEVYKFVDGKYVRLTAEELLSYKENFLKYALALYDANLLIVNTNKPDAEQTDLEKELPQLRRRGLTAKPAGTNKTLSLESKKDYYVTKSNENKTIALRLAFLSFIQQKRKLDRNAQKRAEQEEIQHQTRKEKELKQDILKEAIRFVEQHHDIQKNETLKKLLESTEQFDDLLFENTINIELSQRESEFLQNHHVVHLIL